MTSPPALSREQVREYDRRVIQGGIPGITLMLNAAKGATDILLSKSPNGPIFILCGKGNNGGDGFVIARLLTEKNIPVIVEMLSDAEQITGDAKLAFNQMCDAGITARRFDFTDDSRFKNAEWVVDAMLGTGTQGEIRSPFREAIEMVNRSQRPVFAIDIPSGLDCDTGEPLGPTIVAKMTATFVALKLGFLNPNSQRFTGEVSVVDIGGGPFQQILADRL